MNSLLKFTVADCLPLLRGILRHYFPEPCYLPAIDCLHLRFSPLADHVHAINVNIVLYFVILMFCFIAVAARDLFVNRQIAFSLQFSYWLRQEKLEFIL